MSQSLRGRIALITGASRGIGRAAALAFARAGAHVVALARRVEDLEALDDEIRAAKGEATLVPADVRDFDALDRLGAALFEQWKRLDILVLNAGVLGPVMPLAQVPPKAWAEVLDVNLTANWRLLRSMDPLLRRAEAGRVIAITSGAARQARAYLGGYAVTKAALDMLIKTYAQECATTPIKANLVNPGPMRTDMRARFMPGEDKMTLPASEEIAPLLLALADPALTFTGETIEFRQWRDNRNAFPPPSPGRAAGPPE
jgi:NAD(P)-dependent dehydrogenase (short-subunit alcohol dehydrogenase family)